MTVPGCPRCGDQTLWRVGRRGVDRTPYAWCQLCGHTWDIRTNGADYYEPEGSWIYGRGNENSAEAIAAPIREALTALEGWNADHDPAVAALDKLVALVDQRKGSDDRND